jgi:hypothetical protein
VLGNKELSATTATIIFPKAIVKSQNEVIKLFILLGA